MRDSDGVEDGYLGDVKIQNRFWGKSKLLSVYLKEGTLEFRRLMEQDLVEIDSNLKQEKIEIAYGTLTYYVNPLRNILEKYGWSNIVHN